MALRVPDAAPTEKGTVVRRTGGKRQLLFRKKMDLGITSLIIHTGERKGGGVKKEDFGLPFGG